jgi:C4-dicarboxylate-specific signal transduction histidine kinase
MVHIIEHVRMFARDAGKSVSQPVQVNSVIDSSIEMLGTQFRSRGIELHCDLGMDLPIVLANPFSLEEVVINLLINARDAILEQMESDSMSVPPHVTLRTKLAELDWGECVQIEVADNGVGIPEQVLERVFDPFFTTKVPDKGTGLGLSISRSIVEGFGGTIEIQSVNGEGATVNIYLPIE